METLEMCAYNLDKLCNNCCVARSEWKFQFVSSRVIIRARCKRGDFELEEKTIREADAKDK